ncbi:hypothetical protein ABZY16_40290, partial [Streptomyces sp. NPDC006553]|uniref:hypothetical protein n=1 Tax=Streptomyces sp. NPDC006553 TaxID=3157180 RepID=UPI0033A0CC4E
PAGGLHGIAREDDAPVIVLTGDVTRHTGFDELLEAAAGKQSLPLDHSLFRIEICRRRAT